MNFWLCDFCFQVTLAEEQDKFNEVISMCIQVCACACVCVCVCVCACVCACVRVCVCAATSHDGDACFFWFIGAGAGACTGDCDAARLECHPQDEMGPD